MEISSTDSDVTISPPLSVVTILDNDMVGIGLEEEEYEVTEEQGSVEICVVVTSGSIQRLLVASLVTDDISAGEKSFTLAGSVSQLTESANNTRLS